MSLTKATYSMVSGAPVNVLDYGADSTGVSDSTTAIQDAIDSGASEIYLPAGSYSITKLSIINKDGLHLYGKNAVLEFTGTPVNGTHALAIIQSSNITISDITVDGNNESRGALEGSHNISIYGCRNVVFDSVVSKYSSSDGWYVNRSSTGATINGYALTTLIQTENVTLSNCVADYCCRQGMSGISYINLVAINCKFSNVAQSSAGGVAPSAGVDLEPNQPSVYVPQRTSFIGCYFYNNSGSHLTVNARAEDTLVDGCTFDAGTSYGIYQAGSRTYIRNCVIKNTGAASRPSINSTSQATSPRASCVIENVLIEGAIQGGITITSYADAVLRNIVVRDGANYGVRFVAGTDPGDGIIGYTTIDNLSIERLYENSPPTSIHYIGGSYSGLLTVSNLRIDRTSATGTPIERGADFSSCTNLQELVNFDALGTFATVTANGFNKSYNLQNNRIAGVINEPLNLLGSATYDPASLVDGAGVTTTVTVTGALLGDFAEATFSNALQGILLTAWVSASNIVSVRFQNETGGTIDLASGTLKAKVTRAA